jgi:hypothetical protein
MMILARQIAHQGEQLDQGHQCDWARSMPRVDPEVQSHGKRDEQSFYPSSRQSRPEAGACPSHPWPKDLLGHQHVTRVGGNLKGSIFLLTGGRGESVLKGGVLQVSIHVQNLIFALSGDLLWRGSFVRQDIVRMRRKAIAGIATIHD